MKTQLRQTGKNPFFLLIALSAALLICCSFHAGSPGMVQRHMRDTVMDLYLLIGQSNMAGRGVITADYAAESDPHVWMLDKAGNWIPAKHPLHFDKPAVVGVGPGLAFGMAMGKAATGREIGLVPCAVGGTSIDVWKAGAYDEATKTHPYDDMLLRIRQAGKRGRFKGILWLQGESDSSPEKAKPYLQKLQTLIATLRTDLADPDLPFVAAEIGQFGETAANINSQLQQLPQLVPHTAVVSSAGLTDKGDHLHFDAPSAGELGRRFAQKMIALQQR